MTPAELVHAPAIHAEALSDLGCSDEIVDIDLPTHGETVPRGCDVHRLTTFVVISTVVLTDDICRQ